jgi:2-octaprenyl-6-methoxyphenol hydroxylase
VILAADGRRSKIRDLARIHARTWDYAQSALALVLRHPRPHAHTVREWLRPAGPLALLPLPGDRTGVTWVEPTAAARTLSTLLPADLLARLQTLTSNTLGEAEIESGPSLYPLGALHADRYVAPRLALVGDAAHGVHPIHAQGFNMGVADVGALVDALTSARARAWTSAPATPSSPTHATGGPRTTGGCDDGHDEQGVLERLGAAGDGAGVGAGGVG